MRSAAIETALREAEEEIGLNPRDVHVLGRLDLFRSRAKIAVVPIVAFVELEKFLATIRVNTNEVDSIFLAPLSLFNDISSEQSSSLYVEFYQTSKCDLLKNLLVSINIRSTVVPLATIVKPQNEAQTFRIWG
jgi:hypothetical protein